MNTFDVAIETRLVRVSLRAVVTLVAILFYVDPFHMTRAIVFSTERILAKVTFEWSLISMQNFVSFQVDGIRKRFSTCFTLVCIIFYMDRFHMTRAMFLSLEECLAIVTFEWFIIIMRMDFLTWRLR